MVSKAKPFGKHLRSLRLERKLGLRECAAKVNLSPTYLSRVETLEETCIPSEAALEGFARVLGVDFDELMHLAGRMPRAVTAMILGDLDLARKLRKRALRQVVMSAPSTRARDMSTDAGNGDG